MQKQKLCLSMRFRFAFFLSVFAKRHLRYLEWARNKKVFSKLSNSAKLPESVTNHKSLLMRKLGSTDMKLQINKKTNLGLAIKKLDGLLIAPGQSFSFWRHVGNPTKRKGYLDGLVISRGKMTSGIGGGLCQLSNMIYWMAIHTDLTISERHTHAFDAFPDNNRTIPFGSGATVSYNYYDLVITNNTQNDYQLCFSMDDEFLFGEIRSNQPEKHKHHIVERNHHFLEIDSVYYRQNELWRQTHDKRTGILLQDSLLIKNFSEVKYKPFL